MAQHKPSGSTRGEIQVRNVNKTYGTGPFAKTVVQDCSFTIEHNKLTVMIGPSGCGKSTLIRLLAGFEKPDTGSIQIDGRPITGPGKDRLVVFQESALFPWMTTMDNILYGPRARGEQNGQTQSQADFLLEKVGLKAFSRKYPTQLSGGMQRRAELARAMINNPDVMILDEPFRGLDAMSKELMWEYYSGLYEESHRTNFFVTTDIDEAIFLADRLIVMKNGRALELFLEEVRAAARQAARVDALTAQAEKLQSATEALEDVTTPSTASAPTKSRCRRCRCCTRRP